MNRLSRLHAAMWLALLGFAVSPPVRADVVTDWNRTATQIAADAKLTAPPSNRAIALVQTSVYLATNAITHQYASNGVALSAPAGASVDAAVAAANHTVLLKLMSAQQAAIDAAYAAALAKIPEGQAKRDGIAVGEQAAAAVLASRAQDVVAPVESYRPLTQAGAYVPTTLPAVPQWPQRAPWLMREAAQFRPGPPPALSSQTWVRDYNEIKGLGGKTGSRRTAAQTDMARFWEATMPIIYYGVVRSVADQDGRDVTRNARLLMAVSQAMDDALIAVFDAKYHYNFWRPITAIRNGDLDGNDATEREASWVPFIDTPLHPEYPCAHCIVSSAMGTVLKGELGTEAVPVLTTTSYTADGARREWTSVDDFAREVSEARIYDGVHFRNSTEVGVAMGRQIGTLSVAKYLQPGQ